MKGAYTLLAIWHNTDLEPQAYEMRSQAWMLATALHAFHTHMPTQEIWLADPVGIWGLELLSLSEHDCQQRCWALGGQCPAALPWLSQPADLGSCLQWPRCCEHGPRPLANKFLS